MTATKAGIYLECLYTEADVHLKNRFAAHLEVLRKAGFIDGIHFEAIKDYPGITNQRLDNTDIYIFLVSADMLASDFMKSIKLQNLIERDEANLLELVLVLTRPCDLEQTIFSEFDFLPNNNEPILSEHWHNTDQGFLAVADELKIIAQQHRSSKEELEGDWERTQGSRKPVAYDKFLKNHPDSRYSSQAKDEKDRLREELLWIKVTRNSNMDTLLKYLQQAPLQKYRAEALQHILDLQADEKTLWKDATANQELAFYLEYLRLYPYGEHAEDAEREVEDFLATPFDYNEGKLKTQSYYLQKLALEELNPKEYLSMEMVIQYTEHTEETLIGMIGKLRSQSSLLQLIAYGLVFGMIVLVLLLYYYTGPDSMSIPVLIRYIIPNVLTTIIAMTIMNVVNFMQRDTHKCLAELDTLEHTKIALQIAFILHDKRTITRMLRDLMELEERSRIIHTKEIKDYFGLG